MANPVNRTLIACSVSTLALAIITICYWKLCKRRLLTSYQASSSSSPSNESINNNLLSDKKQQSSLNHCLDSQTNPHSDSELFTTPALSSSLEVDDQQFEQFKEQSKPTISDLTFQGLNEDKFNSSYGDLSDEYDEDLKEIEEIDSLQVEVSSICSSILSKDIVEDSICGEEDPEETETVGKVSEVGQNFLENLNKDKDIETLDKSISDMHINAVSIQNSDLDSIGKTFIDGRKTNENDEITIKNSIVSDEKEENESSKVLSSPNQEVEAEEQIKKSNSNSIISQDIPKVKTQNDKQLPASDNGKGKLVNGDETKKQVRTFSNRRPNQTFAQVLSAKTGQVNGNVNQQNIVPSSGPPIEMSIDAYQNYPDSPAQNSQCSPMSEISDQHSLHSSDSGAGSDSRNNYLPKFHVNSSQPSDYPSPSNVSSEEICYQFNVPSELCGRLIGIKGHMINSIKMQSFTNIIIGPDLLIPNGIKTCSVIGTPENIQCALSLIRQRFPIEDYPDMTLIQTNVVPVPTLELNQSCNLTLLPEILNDAILSCTIDPGHIFVQQPTHPTHPNLQQLDYLMKVNYSQPNVPNVPQAVNGMICVAQNGENWYRAHVKSVSESGLECQIVFVDYGGFASVPVSSLKQIKVEFINLPFQACECYLYNIIPFDEVNGWSEEAYEYFFKELTNKLILVRVSDFAEDSTPLVQLFKRLDNNQTLCINSELVKRGHARWIDEKLAFQ